MFVKEMGEKHPKGIKVGLTRAEAIELRDQMRAFWKNLAVEGQEPTGDTLFAQVYRELSRVLKTP